MIVDPADAAKQAVDIVQRSIVTANDGTEVAVSAQTFCIHADTPGAPKIAAAVMRALQEQDVTLRARRD